MVFLYDVETANPLIYRYKRLNPGLYHKLFIEGDGHFGYQEPIENLALFKGAGFHILEHRGLDKTWIQAPSTYNKLAQFNRGAYLRPLANLSNTRLFYIWTGLMRIVDTMVCPWLPKRWARIDRVVLVKKAI